MRDQGLQGPKGPQDTKGPKSEAKAYSGYVTNIWLSKMHIPLVAAAPRAVPGFKESWAGPGAGSGPATPIPSKVVSLIFVPR